MHAAAAAEGCAWFLAMAAHIDSLLVMEEVAVARYLGEPRDM